MYSIIRSKNDFILKVAGTHMSIIRGFAFVICLSVGLLAITIIGVAVTPAYAATVTWDRDLLDGDDTNFNNAANWSGGSGIPGTGDNATFTGASAVNPNLTASATIQGLTFSTATSSGYTLSANPTFALTL